MEVKVQCRATFEQEDLENKLSKITHLSKLSGLPATVAVENAEKCIFQVLFVVGLLVGDTEDVLHVLPTALVAMASHPKINAK